MLTSSKYSRLLQTSICFALAAMVCVGCGKPKAQPAGETPNQTTTDAPATESSGIEFQSAEQAQQTLAGIWVGRAIFNEETFKSVIAETPESEQASLFKEAQTFASTQMAMQLSADGVKKTAIEVTPAGAKPIQGQTLAQWNVTEVEGNKVLIQSTLKNAAGENITVKNVYLVSPDGNRIVTRANLNSKLAKCEPMIFLDRQIEKRVAEAPTTENVAR